MKLVVVSFHNVSACEGSIPSGKLLPAGWLLLMLTQHATNKAILFGSIGVYLQRTLRRPIGFLQL